jgi:ketosteroid isomerase-like protein
MDLEAIEHVRDLVLRYADGINLYDIDQFGNSFAEDAIWEVTGYHTTQGRTKICETFVDLRNRFDWVCQVVHGTRVLEINGNEAKARSYVAEHGRLRGGGYFFLASYQDNCVRDADGIWRFAHRICDPIYLGPPDNSAAVKVYPTPNRM